jgi:steroid delta-isomerase-like uncharacterized protein
MEIPDRKLEEINKSVARDFFVAIDEGKLDRVKELLTNDFSLHAPALERPWGVQEILDDITRFYTAFPGSEHVIEDLVAEGDKVAARVNVCGTHVREYEGIPATGNKVKIAGTHILSIVGGRIREFWALEDTLGHMMQIGMELKPRQ